MYRFILQVNKDDTVVTNEPACQNLTCQNTFEVLLHQKQTVEGNNLTT